MENKLGQVTAFIVIGIIIVGGAVVFLAFRNSVTMQKIPVSIEPAYEHFLSCVENDALVGIDIMESQAGYIDLPEFETGSTYMPFSSQLDFLGNAVPYWYYVSANNIQKEQVPSKNEMENQLEDFINKRVRKCIFEDYYENGFEIEFGEPDTSVNIHDDKVDVSVDMDISFVKGEDSFVVSNSDVSVNSNLGALYDSALEVYKKEQDELFLENYAVDTLRLYAPVDGVEISCAPLTWNAEEIFEDLKKAIEANTLALKVKSNDYDLGSDSNKYFVIDANVEGEVRFINSANWTNSFEVLPADSNFLISEPIGNQAGLGVMGFCYVPYHYVYNIRYPILVQVQKGDEIFQFPVGIVINGNQPRQSLETSFVSLSTPELCKYMNTPVEVNLYDTKLNPVDGNVSYDCFGVSCEIGKTNSGTLNSNFPQCVNGIIRVNAEGYKETQYTYSSNVEGSVDIILDRVYEMGIDAGKNNAVISFVSDDLSQTIVYPEQKKINLSEGQYEISVYIYENSTLNLASTTREQCIEVPQTGVGGLMGFTKEECFDVTIPGQIISNVLSGGGTENYYILESELAGADVIKITPEKLPVPKSIEDLQNNYILFEDSNLEVEFK